MVEQVNYTYDEKGNLLSETYLDRYGQNAVYTYEYATLRVTKEKAEELEKVAAIGED